MNDKLILKINGNVVEITQDDNGRYSLNDLFRATDMQDKNKPARFFRNKGKDFNVVKLWELTGDSRPPCENTGNVSQTFDNTVYQRKISRATVTFAPLKVVYKYAAFVDKNFYDAVFAAFEALSKGEFEEANNIVSSVAIPPELIDKHNKLRDKMNSLVKEKYPDDARAHSNFNRLVSLVAMGHTPACLTDKSMSAFDWAVKNGHMGAVLACVATIKIINGMLSLPVVLDYQDIALVLEHQTTKNKKRMKDLEV